MPSLRTRTKNRRTTRYLTTKALAMVRRFHSPLLLMVYTQSPSKFEILLFCYFAAKKKKVVRRPMAKKGAAAVPKRKRGEAKSAAKKKKEAKEPKFNASAYLPMRETRTGNMQIDRKAYADSDSDSDDFGGAADADADANADDDDSDDDDDNAPKKKRKNAAMRKVRPTCILLV